MTVYNDVWLLQKKACDFEKWTLNLGKIVDQKRYIQNASSKFWHPKKLFFYSSQKLHPILPFLKVLGWVAPNLYQRHQKNWFLKVCKTDFSTTIFCPAISKFWNFVVCPNPQFCQIFLRYYLQNIHFRNYFSQK